MIYGRYGNPVKIKRKAILKDVPLFCGHPPDKDDREAIENGAYLVVEDANGKSRLYSIASLKADGGLAEIDDAVVGIERIDTAPICRRCGDNAETCKHAEIISKRVRP